MDDLDDVIASFYSVLEPKGDNPHFMVFQLRDDVRADLQSGLKALEEARNAEDDNHDLLVKLIAHANDSTLLDRFCKMARGGDDEFQAHNDKEKESIKAKIAELRQIKTSGGPNSRKHIENSIRHNLKLLEHLKAMKESYDEIRKRQDEFAKAIDSVNRLPAQLALESFRYELNRARSKNLVSEVQREQLRGGFDEAVRKLVDLFHEPGIASKLQLLLKLSISAKKILGSLLETFRTIRNRKFLDATDILALRSLVPDALELKDRECEVKQRIAESLTELDKLKGDLEA